MIHEIHEPTPEEEAAADAIFEHVEDLPPEPPDHIPTMPLPTPALATVELSAARPSAASPLRDYVREIQQEFEEQEEEGKLHGA